MAGRWIIEFAVVKIVIVGDFFAGRDVLDRSDEDAAIHFIRFAVGSQE